MAIDSPLPCNVQFAKWLIQNHYNEFATLRDRDDRTPWQLIQHLDLADHDSLRVMIWELFDLNPLQRLIIVILFVILFACFQKISDAIE